jgi:hypothetical protein
VGSAVLLAEKDRLLGISQIINQICFLQGEAGTRDLTEAELDRLRILNAALSTQWEDAATLEYLRSFERQVDPDIFFENILRESRSTMIRFQNHLKEAESASKKMWTEEVIRLKNRKL